VPVDDRYKTETQKEWSGWAAHGYRKRYQPRSILRLGAVWTILFVAFLLAVILWATRGLS
jgi:hypothetical protein